MHNPLKRVFCELRFLMKMKVLKAFTVQCDILFLKCHSFSTPFLPHNSSMDAGMPPGYWDLASAGRLVEQQGRCWLDLLCHSLKYARRNIDRASSLAWVDLLKKFQGLLAGRRR